MIWNLYILNILIHIAVWPYTIQNKCECLFVQVEDLIFLGSSAVFFTPQCPFSIQFQF